ncbi:hypothetical protein, conserved [Trypanosoma brucei gambiense DAL972]|uniref:Uncharacterized protein n=1 Tax=Trypanosoma brucei gambiense (strain MHOM/CI/86/DAL972) TaxID=679716 RepID=D0A057_TRYB9|nr:hypothetical protein, conserved [Trypanosoma brucei gambiense DAL972]CBH16615.1 hypothetical protein, conserved [Trypanosoma brucei gambiense DAL972]|eukprot:XP_011778879.1 hypothetical protein, conserved [Trypanosoma brucei gambiense DAL972]
MPPLTLEQVLARSMRLPRRIGTKFAGGASSGESLGVSPKFGVGKAAHGGDDVSSLFSLLEKRDEAVAAGRPSIHQSNNLIRNGQDLLAYLQVAKRMRAWEDALKSFSDVTRILKVSQLDEQGTVFLSLQQNDPSTCSGDKGTGVTANVAHITVLLETCARAGQWHLVEQLGEIFRGHTPKVLTDAVALLANTRRDDVVDGHYGWQRAIQFIRDRIPLEEQPVEAYNACLSACEKALDWEGALAVVRLMGPNPLQKLDMNSLQLATLPSSAPACEALTEVGTPVAVDESQEDAEIPKLQPPQPNVVTYATLLSVLDQSGKERLAREVLQRLPALEREEITAAYAALIHVWSEQKYRQRRWRF